MQNTHLRALGTLESHTYGLQLWPWGDVSAESSIIHATSSSESGVSRSIHESGESEAEEKRSVNKRWTVCQLPLWKTVAQPLLRLWDAKPRPTVEQERLGSSICLSFICWLLTCAGCASVCLHPRRNLAERQRGTHGACDGGSWLSTWPHPDSAKNQAAGHAHEGFAWLAHLRWEDTP